ncbi:hypothetical protein [Blastococcus goldschmidtiae]|uniref:Uncharacterized protein n=1 Tax=Blastococcus goldschmidtiae TaxID=3075546 RepID=A0ABU2K618_9ACTN|nr:hypothetical protein [Blastococcus sp. DSM 46792]MDT0275624.1 hypothetical protein [Blastococcus sp. DSM 46792]
MDALLRLLALVGEAYLRGGGSVEHTSGILRTRPVLTIAVGGNNWTMGWRSSWPQYPENDDTGSSVA